MIGVQSKKEDGIKQKKRRTRLHVSRWLMLGIIALGLVGGLLGSYQFAMGRYHQYLALAQQGEQQLRTAQSALEDLMHNPSDVVTLTTAQHAFVAAEGDFTILNGAMQQVPSLGDHLPVYGSKLQAMRELVSLALHFSQAGIVGCSMFSILAASFQNPLHATSGQGLTNANFAQINADAHTLLGEVGQIVSEVQQLQPSAAPLDAHAISELVSLQHALPLMRTWMSILSSVLPVLPVLLGMNAPTNYFIEVLDSTELRPGGGFVGNYGIATIEHGRLSSANITDVDLLDGPFAAAGHVIPFPAQYSWFGPYLGVKSWSLRDSNLDADFPTAARYAEANYALEGGKTRVQGVIAITPALIQTLLTLVGPIAMPDYHVTVTAQNLIDLIHYYQLGAGVQGPDTVASPDGFSSLRKHFTALLASRLMGRLHQLPQSLLPHLMQALWSSLQAKDIQVYLNNAAAEQLLQQLQLTSAIQTPINDGMMLVDANVAGDKANHYLTNAVQDQITLDNHGNALHHMTITYGWNTPGNLTSGPDVYGSRTYADHVQMYVPLGSTIVQQQGWQPLGTKTAYGQTVWSADFTLPFGQTHTVTLVWLAHNVTKKNATGWYYQDLIQRQAGILRTWQTQLTVPEGMQITQVMGATKQTAISAVRDAQTLSSNTLLTIAYSL